MHTQGGKKGFMAIKMDLEKAYDRLHWDFIHKTFLLASLPTILVDLIMHCVSIISMQVLWNGVTSESFHPSRGIHQGDSLSLVPSH